MGVIKMLSIKETKGLTEITNKIIDYVNTLKTDKQRLALIVINAQIDEMLQKLLVLGK